MSADDVSFVTALLRSWRQRPLTWDAVRSRISAGILDGTTAWSRQSLQANDGIQAAWKAAKVRLAKGSSTPTADDQELSTKLEVLEAALLELQAKYDALFIRHRRLIHNASFLPGGTNLLLDPLPDNTPVPTRHAKNRKSRHR